VGQLILLQYFVILIHGAENTANMRWMFFLNKKHAHVHTYRITVALKHGRVIFQKVSRLGSQRLLVSVSCPDLRRAISYLYLIFFTKYRTDTWPWKPIV